MAAPTTATCARSVSPSEPVTGGVTFASSVSPSLMVQSTGLFFKALPALVPLSVPVQARTSHLVSSLVPVTVSWTPVVPGICLAVTIQYASFFGTLNGLPTWDSQIL